MNIILKTLFSPIFSIFGVFRAFLLYKMPKNVLKNNLNFKNIINCLKNIEEQKEKWFWKAQWLNILIGFRKKKKKKFGGVDKGPPKPQILRFLEVWGAPKYPPKIIKSKFLIAYQFIWPLSFPNPFFFFLYDYFKAGYDIFKM